MCFEGVPVGLDVGVSVGCDVLVGLGIVIRGCVGMGPWLVFEQAARVSMSTVKPIRRKRRIAVSNLKEFFLIK